MNVIEVIIDSYSWELWKIDLIYYRAGDGR